MKEIKLSNAFGSLERTFEINGFKFELDNNLLKIHVYRNGEYHDFIDISSKLQRADFQSICKSYNG